MLIYSRMAAPIDPKQRIPEPATPIHRDNIEPSKDRPSGPGDTGPGSTADRNVKETEQEPPDVRRR